MKGRVMTVKISPLLCELHAHSTWSDGELSLGELVDLYGTHGFDVLAVTDHVLRSDDPWPLKNPDGAWIRGENFGDYLEAIREESDRARSLYGMLLIPGLELTYNDPDPDVAGHALAIGLRAFVAMEDGLETAMSDARQLGAAIVAAHPHSDQHEDPQRSTRRFWREWQMLGGVIDRFELFNQREVFGWVASAGLPAVASGDFHRSEHLSSWKTLIPCEKSEHAVVSYLRSGRPAYITRLERAPSQVSREAA
jgi:predicted metal-dependent phosphoesterase TrpH